MRTLFGLIVSGTLLALCGCGAPDASFSWSPKTQDLMPDAEKAVKEYTTQRFGTPGDMVGWQRLPIAFGGVPGRVVEVYTDEDGLVTGFDIDFLTNAMLAKYDANLDNRLAYWELPDELQKEVTQEKFEQADADKDGFLSATEIGKVRTRSELWVTETVSRINDEVAKELVGKELMFLDGTFQYREGEPEQYKVEVTNLDAETGHVDIWPYLHNVPEGGDEPVDLVIHDVIIDFGKTMRSGRHLYMRHCMHCHGVTGDAHGPTAEYLNPRPRDFRDGVFKFVSTRRDIVAGRANRSDLHRTLRHGIPGTYMPSFAMLKDEEVVEIIEYVRWLSMRGNYEQSMNVVLLDYANKTLAEEVQRKLTSYKDALQAFEDGQGKKPEEVSESAIRSEKQKELKEFLKDDLSKDMEEEVGVLLEPWHDAEVETNLVFPKVSKAPSSPASIARGRQLFLGKCAVCHGAMAEGNGENTRGYQKDPDGKEYPEPGFFDIWGHPIKPRNLTLGIYRGGRRPLDIYRRISQGIPGTPMQAFNAAFTDEQIWDLVDYVMSIPIEGAVPDNQHESALPLKGGAKSPGVETPDEQKADAESGEKKPAAGEADQGSESKETKNE